MAQTGDARTGNGTGGSELPNLKAEFSSTPFKRGVGRHGALAGPELGQFAVLHLFGDASFLNGQYTVVGEVVSGMDVVDKIKKGAGRTARQSPRSRAPHSAIRMTERSQSRSGRICK